MYIDVFILFIDFLFCILLNISVLFTAVGCTPNPEPMPGGEPMPGDGGTGGDKHPPKSKSPQRSNFPGTK